MAPLAHRALRLKDSADSRLKDGFSGRIERWTPVLSGIERNQLAELRMKDSMNKNHEAVSISSRMVAFAAAIVLACALMLSGCASNAQQANDPQTLNRQYMANVNQIMDEIDAQMTEFSTIVKEGEVVSLSTQLAAINNSVDKLKALSVPDEMKDIQSDYLKGTEELQTAFAAYVDLYEDVKAPENGTFDFATYGDRLNDVKSHYEAGIQALESADQKAADA